jgi:hypothetical protein
MATSAIAGRRAEGAAFSGRTAACSEPTSGGELREKARPVLIGIPSAFKDLYPIL